MYNYPSVTKVIYETLDHKLKTLLESKSDKKNIESGLKIHREIEKNENPEILGYNIIQKYGEPLYKEKYCVDHRHKYCGRIDYFSKKSILVEYKYIKNISLKNVEKRLERYQLQLGAYYNFLNRFKKITGLLVFFSDKPGEILEFSYGKSELALFKKKFLSKLREYYR